MKINDAQNATTEQITAYALECEAKNECKGSVWNAVQSRCLKLTGKTIAGYLSERGM